MSKPTRPAISSAQTQEAPTPEHVKHLAESIVRWLHKEGYHIPVEWDAALGLLFLGNRKGRTWTRLTRVQIESPDGPAWGLTFARSVVDDWRRLWASPDMFKLLPRTNQQDLESYFGGPGKRP